MTTRFSNPVIKIYEFLVQKSHHFCEESGKKKCTRCGQIKPLGDFYFSRIRQKEVAACRGCINAKNMLRYYEDYVTGKNRNIWQLDAFKVTRKCLITKRPRVNINMPSAKHYYSILEETTPALSLLRFDMKSPGVSL